MRLGPVLLDSQMPMAMCQKQEFVYGGDGGWYWNGCKSRARVSPAVPNSKGWLDQEEGLGLK